MSPNCIQCGSAGPFRVRSDREAGRTSRCSSCLRQAQRKSQHKYEAHRKQDPRYRFRQADKTIRKLYSLEPIDLARMMDKQKHCCATCGVVFGSGSNKMSIDHCHSTGKVRGLLCQNCNLAVGHAKDDPSRLRAMAEYLESTR